MELREGVTFFVAGKKKRNTARERKGGAKSGLKLKAWGPGPSVGGPNTDIGDKFSIWIGEGGTEGKRGLARNYIVARKGEKGTIWKEGGNELDGRGRDSGF